MHVQSLSQVCTRASSALVFEVVLISACANSNHPLFMHSLQACPPQRHHIVAECEEGADIAASLTSASGEERIISVLLAFGPSVFKPSAQSASVIKQCVEQARHF